MSEFDAQGGAVANKTASTIKFRASALAVASALALSGLPFAAQAAGLGKITVFSALGQPLRAEVEVSATREELQTMKASLSSPEAFKAAGLDYATPLVGIRFAVDKRSDGRAVIKLSTDRPVNEPFLDMLMEINWASGRLVREYTFLLDPPEVAAKAAAPVAAPEAKPAVKPSTRPAPAPAAAPSPAPEESAPAPAKPAPKADAAADGGDAGGANSHAVKAGENLNKVATQHRYDGVSLDQMLVGIYRANKDAFDGGNMNRLKSGKILALPPKSEIEAVEAGEAKKVVVAQSADWNAYRRKLAGAAAQAPVADGAGKQEASGRITAKVEEPAAPAGEAKDKVRVSRTETGKGKPGGKVSEDELLAKEKALREANERVATLEKNVNELQKLLEMKNKNLAELQKQASKAPEPPAPVAAVKPPEPVKPAEPPKPVEAAKPVEPPKPAEPAKAVEPPKPAEPEKSVEAPKPAEPPKPDEKKAEPSAAEAAKPVEPAAAEAKKPEEAKPEEKSPEAAKPAEAPKPKAVIPEPAPEEAGFFEDPMVLAGGGGVLALLAGYILYRRRRAGAGGSGETALATSTAGLSQTSLSENSVFRSTGGQSVDTSHTPPQTDFSQAGPGTIDTDEVDPVAEADVYMAYGRDAQAEEILLEAKGKDPKRHAIHLKLLEIYANRQSVKQFETLATELYGETGGVGAEWEKAAAMGTKLDPQNPLYGGKRDAAAAFDSDATVIIQPQSATRSTVTMPGQFAQMAASADMPGVSAPELPVEAPAAISAEAPSLDFDLGPAGEAPASAPVAEAAVVAAPADAGGALDFDLGMATSPVAASAPAAPAAEAEDTVVGLDFEMPAVAAPAVAAEVAPSSLDFDLGLDTASSAASAPSTATAAAAPTPTNTDLVLDVGEVDADALEFDVQLTESTILGQPAPSSFDMTTINLDLAEPKPAPEIAPAPAAADFESSQMDTVVNADIASLEAGSAPISANEEVATKLDLAKAYEEMGDMEGARELLQEVIKEGSADQQAAARTILERVS